MDILVTAAHPDDEILGSGGTLVKRVESGDKVFVCIYTDGCSSKHKMTQKQKACAKKACKEIGVKEVFFLDLKDQRLDTYPLIEINKKVEKIVRLVKPEKVFTHHFGDLNFDHRIVFETTMVASRPLSSGVKEILCYETLSSTEWQASNRMPFQPNVFENIESTINKKLKAFEHYSKTHVSEVLEFPHPRSMEGVKVLAKKRGSEVGLKYAEAFSLVRLIR